MKYIDECNITIMSGSGGNGIVDFGKGSGAPEGGSGGNGGDVLIKASRRTNTLLNIQSQKMWRADDGQKGKYQNGNGRRGKDLILEVPFYTVVHINGKTIKVLSENPIPLLKGVRGGKGNRDYCKANGYADENIYKFEKGQLYNRSDIHLELTVMSDVGFVGKPSAGKSTLLSRITNAKPKVAAYHFTTLRPQLGLVKVSSEESFVCADLPGLIEGASQGKGLGIQFLNHIKRCRAIAHIIDFGMDTKDPIVDYEEITNELIKFDNSLADLPMVVIANKSDLPGYKDRLNKFKEKYPDIKIVPIAALTNSNLETLKKVIWDEIKNVVLPVEESQLTEETITLDD